MVGFENFDASRIDSLWKFCRGDTAISEFENWLYALEDLEAVVGTDCYLHMISIDFRNSKDVECFKLWIKGRLPKTAMCICHTIAEDQPVKLGTWEDGAFNVVERNAFGKFWVHRISCVVCGVQWLVACDELIYDEWVHRRDLGGEWPEVDTYRKLLQLLKRKGAYVGYMDPMNSIEIPHAIETLARETPNIKLSDLEKLLPVDSDVIKKHALDVISTGKVSIDVA